MKQIAMKKPKRKERRKKTARHLAVLRESEAPYYGSKGPNFLTYEDVMSIHTGQIRRYGGTDGIRDRALLQSALAQPEASFGGQMLHEDLFAMAAAYAFHLCQNHPFFDGNKRTALETALLFLDIHGIPILDPHKKLIQAMLSVAAGEMSKTELADIFRSLPTE